MIIFAEQVVGSCGRVNIVTYIGISDLVYLNNTVKLVKIANSILCKSNNAF